LKCKLLDVSNAAIWAQKSGDCLPTCCDTEPPAKRHDKIEAISGVDLVLLPSELGMRLCDALLEVFLVAIE